MPWLIFFTIAIGIAISPSSIVWAKGKTNVCENRVPKPLRALLQRTYSEYQIVNLTMLTDMGQKLYSQDSKNGCPGITKVRFFDKGRVDYGLVISKGTDPNLPIYDLVLAKMGDATSWDLTLLEKDVQAAPPAVLTLPSGKYTGER
ncbi:MAG: hypothetical protein OEY77_06915 [Nitrospira sp.]|nr:hypothetical protein [Nitrospira sp.]